MKLAIYARQACILTAGALVGAVVAKALVNRIKEETKKEIINELTNDVKNEIKEEIKNNIDVDELKEEIKDDENVLRSYAKKSLNHLMFIFAQMFMLLFGVKIDKYEFNNTMKSKRTPIMCWLASILCMIISIYSKHLQNEEI